MKRYKVSIVIITEKNVLTGNEEISFRRALEVFSNYNKYLVIPESTNESVFSDPASALNVIKLPDRHFRDVNAYSRLLLSSFFYELFADSEYILIYQLDCFVFHDNLDEFLAFDYVGAPWFNSQNNAGNAIIRTLLFRKPATALGLLYGYYSKNKVSAVGNGGFSLRRVDKFIEITKDKRISEIISSWVKCNRPHEDVFYSFIAPRFMEDFKIADISSALKFSFETYPAKCYSDNNYQLPVGCHAWAKHDIDFWRNIFRKFNYTIVLFFVFLTPWLVSAQSLPVGTPVLEDYYRRQQLLGEVDSNVSFTVRPVFPAKSTKRSGPFDLRNNEQIKNEKSVFKILPFILHQQYSTHHPYSLNDGAVIPARGYQTMVSGGLYAKYGPLSMQLQPEYVFAENRNFQGFYKEHIDYLWAGYYGIANYIDLPEKFGEGEYSNLFWGQSSIRLTAGGVSLGLSNENLWWGPGLRNSYMMSNTAPGFKHLTLNTVKPLKTFLGSFEGQIICGRLENSGFFPPDTNRTYNGAQLYSPKRDEWRYINGFVFTYHPKWVQGLFVGLTRSFIRYGDDTGNGYKDYFPVLAPFTKKANLGEGETVIPEDQRLSFFFRWLWQQENAEIYSEFGREDHAFNLRDVFVDPDHTRAYTVGFRKLIPFKDRKDQYISFNIELTQLAQTGTNPERPRGSLYLHYAGVRQGYTNIGQLLGAGIGPGGNMQSVNVNWVKNLKKIGIQIERYVHNNDFYNIVIRDVRANWVDFNTSFFGEWDYGNLIFSVRLDAIRCYNYQFLYRPYAGNPPSYWDPGKDVYNYQGQIAVTYRF